MIIKKNHIFTNLEAFNTLKGKTNQCNRRSILLILFLFFNLINITNNIQQHSEYSALDSDFNEKKANKIDLLRNEDELSKNSFREFELSKKASEINDGGNSFAEAVEISFGTTNDEFNDTDGYYEYYKIGLSIGSTIDFTLISQENFILSIYDPSQSVLGSDSTGTIKHVEIVITTSGYHYIELFRGSLSFEGFYNLTVSDPVDGPDGGNSFITATEITLGTFSDNFTNIESNEYFKINLTKEYNVIIDVFGECDNLYFYNSSQGLVEADLDVNGIHLTITATGYYYIRLSHSTAYWGAYSLTVTTEITGNIFYIDGGDDFTTATEVSLGETQNRWTDADYYYSSWTYDYFKVYLNATDLVTFTLSSSYSNYRLYIYDSAEVQIKYTTGSSSTPAQLIITTEASDYYYVVLRSYNYEYTYSLVISTAAGGTDGGGSFLTATEITTGTVNDYLTNNEGSDYFKIILDAGYDVTISVTGECDNLYFYNSSQGLVEADLDVNGIHLTITATGYYYIRLSHSTAYWGAYSLTVTTEITGNIFYIDGGDDFTTATEVSLGETQNRWTDADYYYSSWTYDYFKVYLNATDLVTFTLSSSYSNYRLYIYDSAEVQIKYTTGSSSTPAQLIITTEASDYYYVVLRSYNYEYTYSLIIAKTFYPSEPTNVQATYNQTFNTMIISWTDAPQSGLTYLIYMDTNPIESTSLFYAQSQINSIIGSGSAILTATKIGEVRSGIQRFEYPNASEGTFYFAIIAENEHGFQSSITPGISATTEGLLVKFLVSSNVPNFPNFDLWPLLIGGIVVVCIFLFLKSIPFILKTMKQQKNVRSERKYQRVKLEDMTKNIDNSRKEALVLAQKSEFKTAHVLLDKAVSTLEQSKNNPSLHQYKTQIENSLFQLKQSRADFRQISLFKAIETSENQIKTQIQDGKLTEANNTLERILTELKSMKKISENYRLPITSQINKKITEIDLMKKTLEKEFKRLLSTIETPLSEEDITASLLPQHQRFFCQIDQNHHSNEESHYICIMCKRAVCLECYLDSVKVGLNTCPNCKGMLEVHPGKEKTFYSKGKK